MARRQPCSLVENCSNTCRWRAAPRRPPLPRQMCSANIPSGSASRYVRRLWQHERMVSLLRIASLLVEDAFRWVLLLFRSAEALRTENLFLRRQLALYIERGVRPRRIDPATRTSLTLLARLFDWRGALVADNASDRSREGRNGELALCHCVLGAYGSWGGSCVFVGVLVHAVGLCRVSLEEARRSAFSLSSCVLVLCGHDALQSPTGERPTPAEREVPDWPRGSATTWR